jgi:hypothetical protein
MRTIASAPVIWDISGILAGPIDEESNNTSDPPHGSRMSGKMMRQEVFEKIPMADCRFRQAKHLSMLKALVEAAEDIDAGRTYTWNKFKRRLAILRAKAGRISET